MAESLGLLGDSRSDQLAKPRGMSLIEGMVGRRSLLVLGIGGRRREEASLILLAQNRLWKTSDRSPLVVCTGSGEVWEKAVCG